jgi:predicted RNA binding protein YcfA (HicA-like mRNA interferase family)
MDGNSSASQGSHHILGKAGSIVRLSVPVHGNKPLKAGLQQKLLKIGEIDEGL